MLTKPLFSGKNTKDQGAGNVLVFLATVKTKENSTMDTTDPTNGRIRRQVILPIGFTSGSLRVLENLDERSADGRRMCLCQCECGTLLSVVSTGLKNNTRTSCGCARWKAQTHGCTLRKSPTRTYKAWSNMISRCHGPGDNWDAKYYRDRGITVCERWRASFASFLEDMGECPDGLTLDRIRNNEGYAPGNCRWTDRKTQTRNMRSNVIVEWRGREVTIPELCELTNIGYRTLRARIITRGWSVDRACTTPVRPLRRSENVQSKQP